MNEDEIIELPIVYGYIRVSGRGQISGEGPDRQRETIREFCGSRLVYGGEFFEEGVSGTVEGMDRPKFSEMVEAIECRRKNGEDVAGIVVERMDRLARDLMVQEVLLKQCRERSIKVYAADRGELIDLASDDGDPTRTLIRQVMGAHAQWEKAQTVLKLRKARLAVKRKTGRCEGGVPYGKTPQERAILQTLKIYVNPTMTIDSVADFLNAEGFLTRRGNKWNKKNTLQIMRVAGVWTRKPKDHHAENIFRINQQRKEQQNGRTV